MNLFDNVKVMLFAPGNSPNLFEAGKNEGSNGIIIDLEDTIALADKPQAREICFKYLKNTPASKHFLRGIRINSLKTKAGFEDVLGLIEYEVHPDFIMLAKTEYAEELLILDSLFQAHPILYIALIETTLGIQQIDKISVSSPQLRGFCFGSGDFATDLSAGSGWEPLLYGRSRLICAASNARLPAFDAPYLNVKALNHQELIEEAQKSKALGFHGKFAVDPTHVNPIIQVFTPSLEEVAHAQRVMNAYRASKGDVCEVDGKMIDVPIARAAEKILAQARK